VGLKSSSHCCKVAFVGAGKIGREHIRAFSDVPDVEIAGVHSRTRSRAEGLAKTFNVPFVCDSVQELYEKTHAKLVVVAVPELAARKVSEACFRYPWAVFLEKPPGYNLADAKAIFKAAKAKRRRVFVALNRRFLSSTRAALADLQKTGAPRYIHVQDRQNLQEAAFFGHPKNVVQNWMYANSIHLIDYLRLFGRGKIVSIEPVLKWNQRLSDTVMAKVQFSSGDVGIYEGIWMGPGPWAVSITTSEKRWELRPLEKAAYQLPGERTLHAVKSRPWDQNFKPGFRLQAEMAVNAALGKTTDSVTLDQAMETMGLIRKIFRK